MNTEDQNREEAAKEYYSVVRIKILEGEERDVRTEILNDLKRPPSVRVFTGLPDPALMTVLREPDPRMEITHMNGEAEPLDLIDYHHIYCGRCGRCGSFYGQWGAYDDSAWTRAGAFSIVQMQNVLEGGKRAVADLPGVGCPCFDGEADRWAEASPEGMVRRAGTYYGAVLEEMGEKEGAAAVRDLGGAGEGKGMDIEAWRLSAGPYREWWVGRSAAAVRHIPWGWWMRLITMKLPATAKMALAMKSKAEAAGVDAETLLSRATENARIRRRRVTH
ncbi:MAG: hypothetical protein HYT87_14725 [Nitrospirae bacterium]|nr:hypothetical protein [Nitrospirota bacterium]